MTAAAADRNTVKCGMRDTLEIPVAASTTIYYGTMVVRDAAGNARPAADTDGYKMAGVSLGDLRNGTSTVDNSTGSAGDKYVTVERRGVFEFVGSGLTKADVGKKAYIADDQTVTLTEGHVYAGLIADFDGTATHALLDITDAVEVKTGKTFTIAFSYPGTVGASGVKALEDVEFPRAFHILGGFASCITAPSSTYTCEIVVTDGTTSFQVDIVGTATKGENKTKTTTPMLAETDIDITLTDDDGAAATADVTGILICEEL